MQCCFFDPMPLMVAIAGRIMFKLNSLFFRDLCSVRSYCSALFPTIVMFLKSRSSDSINQIHLGILLEIQISCPPVNQFLSLRMTNLKAVPALQELSWHSQLCHGVPMLNTTSFTEHQYQTKPFCDHGDQFLIKYQ